MNEFEVIEKFFNRANLTQNSKVALIGDDAALVQVPETMQLAQSIDSLVEGVHFSYKADAYAIGYRALAVNLSDLAAMGAKPLSFMLALTVPTIDETWLEGFSQGLADLAQQSSIALIGGDLTKGPLTVTIQCQGLLPKSKALLRSGAQVDDLIYVTGTLGNAAGAVYFLEDTLNKASQNSLTQAKLSLVNDYWFPQPRIAIGQWLSEHGATSAIDISDGLLGDLHHLLTASDVGAQIQLKSIPISTKLNQLFLQEEALRLAISGGDDYELCFTIPRYLQTKLEAMSSSSCRLSCIGKITAKKGELTDFLGNHLDPKGYSHF